MARNGGYSEREMRQKQEDTEKRLQTRNVRKKLLNNLQVADVLPLLSEVMPENKKEEIECILTQSGRTRAADRFLDIIVRHSNWLYPLLDALHSANQADLAELLLPGYIPVEE
ncbi:uncharacterized protein LOC100181377 [Ciona intestinalis]